MTPDYSWRCLACGHTNKAATSSCATCACPAAATVARVESARAKQSRAAGQIHPVAATPPPASQGAASAGEQEGPPKFAIMVLCALAILAGMTYSVFYVGPSGQRTDVSGFILLWFREIVVLAMCLLAILATAIAKMLDFFEPRSKPAQAPIRAESNGRAWE